MLLLSSKVGEKIIIGTGEDATVVTVCKVNTMSNGEFDVKLGFDALKHISIDRSSVRKRKELDIKNNGD